MRIGIMVNRYLRRRICECWDWLRIDRSWSWMRIFWYFKILWGVLMRDRSLRSKTGCLVPYYVGVVVGHRGLLWGYCILIIKWVKLTFFPHIHILLLSLILIHNSITLFPTNFQIIFGSRFTKLPKLFRLIFGTNLS
jgi:hypothetical protein